MISCFTDCWPVLFDDEDKPLVGRVKFFDAGTTTYKPIWTDSAYSVQGANPMKTDATGKTESQVFLKGGLYTVVLEKFLGTNLQDMDEYWDDDSMWSQVKVFQVWSFAEESSLGSFSLNSSSDLAAFDPGVSTVAITLGFYAKGDSPAKIWYYDASDTGNADGIGTVKSGVSGYNGNWHWVAEPYVDSGSLGVVPGATSSQNSARLSAAALFCYNENLVKQVSFRDGLYPCPTRLSLDFGTAKLCLSDGASFSGMSVTLKCGELHAYEDALGKNITLQPKEGSVRSSWWTSGTKISVPSACLVVIDEGTKQHTVANSRVLLEAIPVEKTVLNGCSIETGSVKITNRINLQNMEVSEGWFSSGYDFQSLLAISGCSILIDNFSSGSNYIICKNKQYETDYGNLKGKTVVSSDYSTGVYLRVKSGADTDVSNLGKGSSLPVLSYANLDSAIYVEDSYLTISWVNGQNPVDISIKDSEVTCTGSFRSITAKDSSVSFTKETSYAGTFKPEIYLEGSSFTFADAGVIVSSLDSKDSSVTGTVVVNETAAIDGGAVPEGSSVASEYFVSCKGATINGTIESRCVSGTAVNFIVERNTFGANGKHVVSCTYTDLAQHNTVDVAGAWVENYSYNSTGSFVELQNTEYFLLDDRAHHYVYRGNIGTGALPSEYTGSFNIDCRKWESSDGEPSVYPADGFYSIHTVGEDDRENYCNGGTHSFAYPKLFCVVNNLVRYREIRYSTYKGSSEERRIHYSASGHDLSFTHSFSGEKRSIFGKRTVTSYGYPAVVATNEIISVAPEMFVASAYTPYQVYISGGSKDYHLAETFYDPCTAADTDYSGWKKGTMSVCVKVSMFGHK